MAQIAAYFTYSPVELDEPASPLECYYNEKNYCWSEPWWWMHERNVAREECMLQIPKLTYKIGKKEFNLKISTYTYEPPCKLEKTIYVSPLNPSWAIADNRMPGWEPVKRLLYDFIKVLFCISLFISLSCTFLSCRPRQVLSTLNTETRKMNVINALIIPYYAAATAQIIEYMYVYALNPEEIADHGFLDGGVPTLIGVAVYLIYVPLRYIFLIPPIYWGFRVLCALCGITYPLGALLFYIDDPRTAAFVYLLLHFVLILIITAYNRLKKNRVSN